MLIWYLLCHQPWCSCNRKQSTSLEMSTKTRSVEIFLRLCSQTKSFTGKTQLSPKTERWKSQPLFNVCKRKGLSCSFELFCQIIRSFKSADKSNWEVLIAWDLNLWKPKARDLFWDNIQYSFYPSLQEVFA